MRFGQTTSSTILNGINGSNSGSALGAERCSRVKVDPTVTTIEKAGGSDRDISLWDSVDDGTPLAGSDIREPGEWSPDTHVGEISGKSNPDIWSTSSSTGRLIEEWLARSEDNESLGVRIRDGQQIVNAGLTTVGLIEVVTLDCWDLCLVGIDVSNDSGVITSSPIMSLNMSKNFNVSDAVQVINNLPPAIKITVSCVADLVVEWATVTSTVACSVVVTTLGTLGPGINTVSVTGSTSSTGRAIRPWVANTKKSLLEFVSNPT